MLTQEALAIIPSDNVPKPGFELEVSAAEYFYLFGVIVALLINDRNDLSGHTGNSLNDVLRLTVTVFPACLPGQMEGSLLSLLTFQQELEVKQSLVGQDSLQK